MILERTERKENKYNFSDLKTRSREMKVVIRRSRPDKINTWAIDVSNNSLKLVEEYGADGFYVEVLL